ncbi:MAG: VOC family protein [Actinobacteria bacterium]|nr:VOC family protein [Actinomycetota bacterium]
MTDADVRLGHVLLPVEEMDTALAFFEGVLGLSLRFRDGSRYAALDAGEGTIALLDPSEQPVRHEVAIGLKAADLDALEQRVRAAGAEIVRPLAETEHERSFAFRAPGGAVLVAYAPRG